MNLIEFISKNPKGVLRTAGMAYEPAYYIETPLEKGVFIQFLWNRGIGYSITVSSSTIIEFRNISNKLSTNYGELMEVLIALDKGEELVEVATEYGSYFTTLRIHQEEL
jgi:hypothetical protein